MAVFTISAEIFSDALASRGTITRVLSFRNFAAVNQIGSGEITLALDDTQSIDLINENDFIVVTIDPGGIGTEIIASRFMATEPEKIINPDGTGYFRVTGPCFLHELTRRNLSYTIISDGSGGKDAGAANTILAFSDKSWTDTTLSAFTGGAYIVASGETVWDTYLNHTKHRGNFLSLSMKIDSPTEPEFNISIWAPSHAFQNKSVGGLRFSTMKLIDNADDTTTDEYPILSFEIAKDSTQAVTRLHVFGAGQGQDRFSLEDATATPPAGFSVNTSTSVITNTTLEAITNQPVIEKVQHFSHIKSEDPTDATANVTAANELQRTAITWLQEHDGSNTTYYKVETVVKRQHQVGQLVTLTHTRTSPWDAAGAENNTNVISINDTFVLLEYETYIDADGNLAASCLLGDAPVYKPTGDRVMAKRVKDLETVVRHSNSGQSTGAPATPQGQDSSFLVVAGTTALPNERSINFDADFTTTDNGANSTYDVSLNAGTGTLHAALTLGGDADNFLELTGQLLGLDTQTANTIFSGPTSGGAANPAFRSLVDGDIPAAIARDSELHDAATVGNGVTISGQEITLGTPSTLTTATANATTASSHTHAITSSSDPGTNASLLGTDASGHLTLDQLTVDTNLFINETADSDVTIGITINQGGNTDRAQTFKSSLVAHGMTAQIETDTYGYISQVSGGAGGVGLVGLTESAIGLAVAGACTNETTTDTSSSDATILMTGYTKSGTALGSMSNAANILSVRNAGSTKFIIKGNGDLHAANTTITALDNYDDVALLRTFDRVTTTRGIIDSQWDKFIEYNRTHLESAGVIVGDFISIQALQRLTSGAVWQLHERIAQLEARLGNT